MIVLSFNFLNLIYSYYLLLTFHIYHKNLIIIYLYYLYILNYLIMFFYVLISPYPSIHQNHYPVNYKLRQNLHLNLFGYRFFLIRLIAFLHDGIFLYIYYFSIQIIVFVKLRFISVYFFINFI